MAKLETLTVDLVHVVLHDQIKDMAQSLADRTGVRVKFIAIDWYGLDGPGPAVKEIKIDTAKG